VRTLLAMVEYARCDGDRKQFLADSFLARQSEESTEWSRGILRVKWHITIFQHHQRILHRLNWNSCS